jgi:hypothetical protein
MRAHVYFGEYSRTHLLVTFANIAITFVRWLARLADIRQTVLRGLANIRQTVLQGLARLANGEC